MNYDIETASDLRCSASLRIFHDPLEVWIGRYEGINSFTPTVGDDYRYYAAEPAVTKADNFTAFTAFVDTLNVDGDDPADEPDTTQAAGAPPNGAAADTAAKKPHYSIKTFSTIGYASDIDHSIEEYLNDGWTILHTSADLRSVRMVKLQWLDELPPLYAMQLTEAAVTS